MVMITDEEFVTELINKGLVAFKSKRQLAFAIGLDNAQTLNHWIKRKKVPGDLKPAIAGIIGIDWLGDRQQETPVAVESNTKPAHRDLTKVPLISSVQAGEWSEAIDIYELGFGESMVLCTASHSPSSFALTVKGDSMTSGTGKSFPNGMIIIVDPDKQAENGDFVVARVNGDNEAVFKQLIHDGSRQYLKPLNQQYPMITEHFDVIGRVIQMTMEL